MVRFWQQSPISWSGPRCSWLPFATAINLFTPGIDPILSSSPFSARTMESRRLWLWKRGSLLWPDSGWNSLWSLKASRPSVWWGPTSWQNQRSLSRAWATPPWAWTTALRCRVTPARTERNLNSTQVGARNFSVCCFYFDPPICYHRWTARLLTSASQCWCRTDWHLPAGQRFLAFVSLQQWRGSSRSFYFLLLLWSHSERTHHVAGRSMQSSSAERSQLRPSQRSGNHEETVQVPHTQRVCPQNQGTLIRFYSCSFLWLQLLFFFCISDYFIYFPTIFHF